MGWNSYINWFGPRQDNEVIGGILELIEVKRELKGLLEELKELKEEISREKEIEVVVDRHFDKLGSDYMDLEMNTRNIIEYFKIKMLKDIDNFLKATNVKQTKKTNSK